MISRFYTGMLCVTEQAVGVYADLECIESIDFLDRGEHVIVTMAPPTRDSFGSFMVRVVSRVGTGWIRCFTVRRAS